MSRRSSARVFVGISTPSGAMALLAAHPTENGAHQQFRIEAVGLRTPMFARCRDARGMDDISLDITRPQPTRRPKAVTASLISDDNALDLAPSLAGLIAIPLRRKLPGL
jgi:hypothetical protein